MEIVLCGCTNGLNYECEVREIFHFLTVENLTDLPESCSCCFFEFSESFMSTVLMALLLVGLFFILPCIDSYQKVDLRTVSFDVPPQEVKYK